MTKVIRACVPAIYFLAFGLLGGAAAMAQQVPKELQPPADEQSLLQVHARGEQIYTCNVDRAEFTWMLKAPEAQLTDASGKPFGKHFAGPSWEASDGSRVTGKAVANAPSPDPDSIPWLLVKAAEHSGEGKLARVSSIQRIDTRGGKAPASGCDAFHVGQEIRVPYSADYVFFVSK